MTTTVGLTLQFVLVAATVFSQAMESQATTVSGPDPTTDKLILLDGVTDWDTICCAPSRLDVSGNAFKVVTAPNGKAIVAASNYFKGKVIEMAHEGYISSIKTNSGSNIFFENALKWFSYGKNCSVQLKIHELINSDREQTFITWAQQVNISGSIIKNVSGLNTCDVLITRARHNYTAQEVETILDFIRQGGSLMTVGHNWAHNLAYASILVRPSGIVISAGFVTVQGLILNLTLPTPKESLPFIKQDIPTINFPTSNPASFGWITGKNAFGVYAGNSTDNDSYAVVGSHFGLGRVLVFSSGDIFTSVATSPSNKSDDTYNVLVNAIHWLGRYKGCEAEYKSVALDTLAETMAANVTLKRNNFNTSSCISPLILDGSESLSTEEIEQIQDDVLNGKSLLVGAQAGTAGQWVNSLLQAFGIELVETSSLHPFPGFVKLIGNVTTSETFVVQVDATYHTLPPGLQGQTTSVWRSTGIFANAHESIRVEVPAKMVNQNFKIQIGTHPDDLSNLQGEEMLRSPNVITQMDIDSATIEMTSPFGGLIVILVPPGSNLGTVDVTIVGGYQATVVSYDQNGNRSILSKQNLYEVPFGEIRGDKVVLILLQEVIDVILKSNSDLFLIQFYDNMFESYEYLGIEESNTDVEKAIIVLDEQTSTGQSLQNGYPIVVTLNRLTHFTDFENGNAWLVMTTIACQYIPSTWQIPAVENEISNLFSAYALRNAPSEITASVLSPQARQDRITNYTLGGRNFSSDWKGLTAVETYLQLKDSFGWDMYKISLPNSDASMSSVDGLTDLDRWVISTSKLSGYNLYAFYKDYWGWPLSNAVSNAVNTLPEWPYQP